jgi:hypothetical protein
MMRKIVTYLLAFSDRNKVFNWCVGHTVGPLLLTLLFGLFGHAWLGAFAGVAWYVPREAEVVGAHWVKAGVVRVSADNIGDIAGPVLIFLVALCLTT